VEQANTDTRASDHGHVPGGLDAAAVMYYSHDSYGLGHLRRTLALAQVIGAGSQLIVTGSPLAHRFSYPPRTDYIKLPCVLKRGAGRYEPRYLRVPFSTVRLLRQDVLLSAARHMQPDALIVDNVPPGLKGELVPTLRHLSARGCRLVLGLRDIVDEGDWVRSAWAKDGSYELLEDVYDRVLVYGRRDVYDVAAAYGFSPSVAAKTRYVGYLRRAAPRETPDDLRRRLGLEGDHLLLVMAGGGGDGYELLRVVVEALRLRADRRRFDCILLGGPLMPDEDRRRVVELVDRTECVRYLDFVADVASYVAAADAVVSMGGYNSVCELLSAGKTALLVPRIAPRREQLIRAEALGRRGLLRWLHPDQLGARRMLTEIEALLAASTAELPRLPLDGLHATAAAVGELLAAPGPIEAVASA
jgi:predicted glycosyltransferase